MLQKRLKKEKKARRKIQDQMEIIEQRGTSSMIPSEHMSTPPNDNMINTNGERKILLRKLLSNIFFKFHKRFILCVVIH